MVIEKGEHISKNTEFKKGRIPYNKGLKKQLDLNYIKEEYLKGKSTIDLGKELKVSDRTIASRLKELGNAIRNKHSELTKEKIRLKTIEQFKNGMPQETKRKIGLKSLGNKRSLGIVSWNKGIPATEESKENNRKIRLKYFLDNPSAKLRMKEQRAKQIFPKKDSKIEIKIQNFLEQLGIDYLKHKYMNIKHSYQCDIFIPSLNLVIECDGNYWHKYPTRRDIDNIRTDELIKNGFRVLRLWEVDIIPMNLKDFKELL